MNTPQVDRLLNKILELPRFMSVELTDLRDSYLLLLGPRAPVSQTELSEYLLRELENLKKRLLIQQYENLPDDELRFLVDEQFYRCEKHLVEGPFERRIRIGLEEQDIQILKNRENELKAKLARKMGEIDECLSLSREFPTLAKPLDEKHRELSIQACALEGRIQTIKETIGSFSSSVPFA